MASTNGERPHARTRSAQIDRASLRVANARLRREVAALQTARAAINQIIGVIGRASGRDERLMLLCADFRALFQAEAAAFYLYNASGPGTQNAYFSGYTDAEGARHLALGQEPRELRVEALLRASGRAVITDPVAGGSARPVPDPYSTWQTLIVPLWYAGTLTGCLYLSRVASQPPFTRADATLGDNLAATAGLVIARIGHEAVVQRRASRVEALREIAHQLTAELDFERFLDGVATHLMTLMNVRDCLLTAWDEVAQELQTLFYIGDGLRQDWRPTIRPAERRGLAGVVASERRTVHVPDYLEECIRQGIVPVVPEGDWRALAWVGVPLLARGRLVGVIIVERRGQHFDVEEVALLESLAGQLAVAMENVRLYAEVRQLALSDPLTGLTNHRHLHERLDQELGQAIQHGRPLAVVMIDLDGFKRYNDTYGHQVGDTLLRLVADTLRAEVRAGDILGRYGGDEFLLILPETTHDQAAALLDRFAARLAAVSSPVASPVGAPLTAGRGIAAYPDDASAANELIALADAALYAQKKACRTVVCS